MKSDSESNMILESYKDLSVVEKELNELKTYWHGKLNNLMVQTPSSEFNNMINT